jgi:hypothetical protein
MRRDEFTAIRQQPTQLVPRDVRFAGLDYGPDFFEVLGPIARTSRMHQQPAPPIARPPNAQAARRRRLPAAARFML